MNEQRPLIEKVLDIAVYAPVGLVLQLRSDADALVTNGRTRVTERVQVARWIGEMAVTFGRRELEKRIAAMSGGSNLPSAVVSEEVVETASVAEVSAVLEPPSPAPPFDGYQSLAAAQVVQLFGRLSADELATIRAYESANRARRTILAKLDQLLGNA